MNLRNMGGWGSLILKILIFAYLDLGLKDSSKMKIKCGETLLKKDIVVGGIFLTLIKLMPLFFGRG
jgi:hypothetical protein